MKVILPRGHADLVCIISILPGALVNVCAHPYNALVDVAKDRTKSRTISAPPISVMGGAICM
jgi:hypothetical protein